MNGVGTLARVVRSRETPLFADSQEYFSLMLMAAVSRRARFDESRSDHQSSRSSVSRRVAAAAARSCEASSWALASCTWMEDGNAAVFDADAFPEVEEELSSVEVLES
jgi:hypothetical protein